MKKITWRFIFMVLVFQLTGFSFLLAGEPTGYYSSANGLCGADMKTALYNIIKTHTSVSYATLWTSFKTTDVKSNGKVWDMYSNVEFTFTTDQCGTYSAEGDCYNREHSFPKSWFNEATPMYTDLFHMYPTDGYVNNRRSNYPFGEVSSPTYTSNNGGKLGPCSYSGYTGIVFEPIDEYKGDFARTYFYMVTCYQNVVASWENNTTEVDAILDGTTYPCFEPWFLNMLLEWNTLDPVSTKETNRNDAVYAIQKNRNPFIDHPEYVDAIWGTGCSTVKPTVILSVSSTSASEAAATTITVTVTASSAVTSAQTVSLAVSGTNVTSADYTLGSSTITIASGATTGSTTFKITDDSSVESTETATLTISSPSSGITLGITTSQAITITDNDVVIPTVNLSVSSTTATEAAATSITVTVTASSAVTSAQTVSLAIAGTNITTADYTLGSSTIIIASGATTGTTTFKITDDTSVEGTETATLTISSPSSGITLGSTTTQSVTITDNDSNTTCATDLIISEYVEGSSNNKYIEIYNGTSSSIDLSGYQLLLFANGATSATTTNTLSGTLASKAVKVYKNSSATIYTGTTTSATAVAFNGNDAIALKKISTGAYVDIFGRIGTDPGTAWISGSYSTLDKTLVRKSTVYSGIKTNPSSGFPTLSTEWDVYSTDVVSYLGSHTMSCSSSIEISYEDATQLLGTEEVQLKSNNQFNAYYDGTQVIINPIYESFSKAVVNIFDISGRQLVSFELIGTEGQVRYEIPASLPYQGIYILQMNCGIRTYTKKLIK